MAQRTKQVKVAFNRGALSPHLDGRLDLFQAGNAVRTCTNFLVDREGGLRRRPGTRFIAEAGAVEPLDYVSYEGVARLYGITEFLLSGEMPRKYLHLHHGQGGWRREIDASTKWEEANGQNREAYNTSGSNIANLSVQQRDQGGAGTANLDTLEDYVPDTPEFRDPNGPEWQRTATRKWLEDVNLSSLETPVSFYAGTTLIANLLSGLAVGVQIISRSRNTDGSWDLVVRFRRSHGFAVVSGQWTLAVTMANGDQLPPDVTAAGSVLLLQSTSGSDQGVLFSNDVPLVVPPGASIRLFAGWDSGAGQLWYDASDVQAGQEAAGINPWFYFPELGDPMPGDYYEERLGTEDTLLAAIQRGSGFVVATEDTAFTTSLTGGVTAESHDPMDWEGRLVVTSRTFRNLTVGHRYTVVAFVRTNTIGLEDFFTTSLDAGEFTAVADTHVFEYASRAPVGRARRVLALVATDQGGTAPAPTNYESETVVWWGKVLAAGGAITGNSLTLLNNLIVALKATGAWGKFRYVLPLLGSELDAALTPALDRGIHGRPTNANFVDGDFSESTGLQGNGTNKILTLPFTSGALGSSGNGGLGYWETNMPVPASPNFFPVGAFNTALTNHYSLDLRTTLERWTWGQPVNAAATATAAGNHHYYGQRSSATSRVLYRNGSSVATNTTSDATSGATEHNLKLMGEDVNTVNRYWAGRGGIAYFTNGTLTSTEIADVHTAIAAFMSAAGRI